MVHCRHFRIIGILVEPVLFVDVEFAFVFAQTLSLVKVLDRQEMTAIDAVMQTG